MREDHCLSITRRCSSPEGSLHSLQHDCLYMPWTEGSRSTLFSQSSGRDQFSHQAAKTKTDIVLLASNDQDEKVKDKNKQSSRWQIQGQGQTKERKQGQICDATSWNCGNQFFLIRRGGQYCSSETCGQKDETTETEKSYRFFWWRQWLWIFRLGAGDLVLRKQEIWFC